MTTDYSKTINSAVRLATKLHAGQTRRDGTPYINHPIRVMKSVGQHAIICGFTNEERIVASAVAVLHDVVEDTFITKQEFISEFDSKYAERCWNIISKYLTKTKEVTYSDYIFYITSSVGPDAKIAKIVKYHDMLDNMNGCMEEINQGVNFPQAAKQLKKYAKYFKDIYESMLEGK